MHFNKTELIPSEILGLLRAQFQIINSIKFQEFDMNWDTLRTFFINTKKQEYHRNDRYLIVHQDTDIYIDEMCVGVNLRNFFQVVQEIDIPFYTLIIWTNHFGLQKEIDILCKNRHAKDRPMLIESFSATPHITDHYHAVDLDADQIEYHAISMMGAGRSHRFALYHELKDLDPAKIAVAIRGNNE
jgi:hypothetical protein